ncbi:MAG: CAP domain-containing protein [Oscillospiraceae bacterium]|nr:CAP domain-containing protein [Oscillospiraceae bacterium]
MKKKTIALLLTMTLCLSLLPVGALAITAEDTFEADASEDAEVLAEPDEEGSEASAEAAYEEDDTESSDGDVVELAVEPYEDGEDNAELFDEDDVSSEVAFEEAYLEETGAEIAGQTIDDLDGNATVVYAEAIEGSGEADVAVIAENAAGSAEDADEASEEPIAEVSEDSEDVPADDAIDEESDEVTLLTQTLTAATNGITVTLTGSLPENATVSITPVSYDDSEMEVLLAVDITIYNPDGTEFEPENDTIAVTIQSDAIDGNNEVYHITENGEAEKVSSDASDGAVVFDADHFSVYVVTSTDTDAGTSSVAITGTYYQEEARSMLSLINAFRTGDDAWYWNDTDTEKVYVTGLSELTYDYDLEQIAMQRAAELAISYSHTRPDGSSCFSVKYNGITSAGENIWYSYSGSTAESAFYTFLEENQSYSGQGHRRLMLSDTKASVGIACVEINGCYYWVMEFGWSSYNATSTGNLDGTKEVTTTVTNEYLDSQTHNFVSTVVKEATCTEDGQEKLVCSDCGYTKYSTIAATGHTHDNGVVTTEATCSTEGVKTYTCTVCGASYTETIPATGTSDSTREVPQTGDTNNITIYVLLLGICGSGLAVLLVRRKKVK